MLEPTERCYGINFASVEAETFLTVRPKQGVKMPSSPRLCKLLAFLRTAAVSEYAPKVPGIGETLYSFRIFMDEANIRRASLYLAGEHHLESLNRALVPSPQDIHPIPLYLSKYAINYGNQQEWRQYDPFFSCHNFKNSYVLSEDSNTALLIHCQYSAKQLLWNIVEDQDSYLRRPVPPTILPESWLFILFINPVQLTALDERIWMTNHFHDLK